MGEIQNPTASPLPGIGERLDVTDSDGNDLCAIRLRSGQVELHSGDDVIALEAVEAASLGAFISGHFRMSPELADRLSSVLGGLVFDWVRLGPQDAAVGHTIEELGVRRRTGVTIVAILRGSIPIVAPDPAIALEAGDELVIACCEQDLERFGEFMTKGE